MVVFHRDIGYSKKYHQGKYHAMLLNNNMPEYNANYTNFINNTIYLIWQFIPNTYTYILGVYYSDGLILL